MKRENVEYFLIQSVKDDDLFLHRELGEDGYEDDEGKLSLATIDFSARISSVFGVSDDIFNGEFEPAPIVFESKGDAEEFLECAMEDSGIEIEGIKVVKVSFGMIIG